jgi:hypothetical protein
MGMTGEKPVTPAQAAHENQLRLHRNGAMNLAAHIPEFVGKVLGPWLVPAPQDGPGMKRYAETPGIAADERRSMEPWNFPQPEPPQIEISNREYSRWSGEPLGEAAGVVQSGGISQSH